jgi:cellobiose-specific phosphotransferase system component IIA
MNVHRDLLRAARANAQEAVRLHRAGNAALASALLACAKDQINRAKAARLGSYIMKGTA